MGGVSHEGPDFSPKRIVTTVNKTSRGQAHWSRGSKDPTGTDMIMKEEARHTFASMVVWEVEQTSARVC